MITPVVTETKDEIDNMTPQQISQLKTKYELPQSQEFRCVYLVTQLYKRLCPSVGPSIGPSVRPSVCPSVCP